MRVIQVAFDEAVHEQVEGAAIVSVPVPPEAGIVGLERAREAHGVA